MAEEGMADELAQYPPYGGGKAGKSEIEGTI
jgi:hypothetical protein